ncbi:MAG: hypothetical protein K2K31_03395 [Clostridia bacterium]|nr:hypothetical protein [Clostridia bacterium]
MKFDNSARNDASANSKNYISISNLPTSGGGNFGFVENNLNLNVGETVEQSFYVSIVESGQNQSIDGLVITFEDGKEKVTFDNTDNMKLIFNVGYGDADVDVMAGQIFNKNATTENSAVPTVVTYNDEYYLLFYRGETYTVFDYYTIEQTTNNNLSIGQKTIEVLASYTSFVTESGNVIRVSRTFDGALTVNLTFNVIITQLEKQLVYYEDFEDVDWSWFIDDYQKLIDNNIYQEITSGNSYEILHDTYGTTTNYKQAGFFYNSLFATTNSALGNKKADLTLSIVENATIDGQNVAEVKEDNKTLVLKDISSEHYDVYIVLQLKFEVNGSSINKSIFYRIKVVPNFELGTTNYPYASDGEYLNTNSPYYKNGSYVVDMEETLDSSNSKYTNSKRLSDLTTDVENITYEYAVKEVLDEKGKPLSNYSQYVSFNIVGSEIKITPNTTKQFSVVVERNYYHDGVLMLGSEMEYKFLLNQSPVYSQRVTQNGELLNIVTGTNIYDSTVRAGTNETEYTTLVYDGSGSVENLVADYNAYISGNDIENYLHRYFVINKGASVYNVSTSKVETLANSVGFDTTLYTVSHVLDSLNGQDVYVKVTVTNKENVTDKSTYYLANTTLQEVEEKNYQYFYLSDSETIENAKILHVTPNETVSHDNNFEIGFYSDKCVMFRINLVVTSRYVITITDSTLKGGEEYNFSQIVTSITDVNGNNVLGDNVSYTIMLSDEETNTNKVLIDDRTISFAQLQNDTTFKFVCQITEGESVYTYDFVLNIKASFSLDRRNISGADRYSGDTFNIDLESEEFRKFFMAQTEFEAFSFSPTEIVTTKEITNKNVEADIDMTETLTIYYFFATTYEVGEDEVKVPNFDEYLFSFTATYSYKVLMNVDLQPNYPMPNSNSKLDVEYIGTNFIDSVQEYRSINYTDFFGSISPFGQKDRITITDLGVAETETRPHDISIMISNISNASVIVTTGGRTKTYSNAGSEIVSGADSFDGINLTFVLLNSSNGTGNVDFSVYVNSVETSYSVIILTTDILTVTPNATNYTDSQETIYLDEYSSQEEELFQDNRILKYTLKQNVTPGQYYVRLHNPVGNLYETITLNVRQSDSGTINLDLGKGYDGYEVVGTYRNANFSTEADIFTTDGQPKLTSRITVTYYGGIEVEFNETTRFYLIDENNNKITKEQFKLTDSDYQKTKSISAKVETENAEFNLSNFVYRLYLDIAFDVEKSVVNIDKYDFARIQAGTRKTLLGTTSQNGLAETFGIKNKKTKEYYKAKDIEDSSATLGLWIYGVVPSGSDIDMTLSSNNAQAWNLHHKLMSDVVTEGDYNIIYKTGLMPRVGTLNGGYADGDQRYNYLDLTPTRVNDRNTDYTIIANGSNNDGNFVLMKLIYSAKIGDVEITKSFDILFKVEPNSEIKMKVSPTSDPSETNIMEVDNQRVNYNNGVYEILCSTDMPDSEKLIYLTSTSDRTGVLSAKMYGSSASSEDSFTFDYVKDIEINHNSEEIGYGHVSWTSDGHRVVEIEPVNLGVKNYIISMENSFGYKARFYFRLVAEANPTINTTDSNTVFTEGNKLVFGGMFNKVKEEGMASYQFVYDNAAKEIQITGANYISHYTLQTTTVKFGTITKSGEVTGNISLESGKELECWYNALNSKVTDLNIESDFVGCMFYLTLTINRNSVNEMKTFSVSYNGETLKTGEHVIGINEKATLGDANTDVIYLKDVDAYAYSNNISAIDLNSARLSSVNRYSVIGIELFIKGESVASVGGKDDKYIETDGVNLVTGSTNSYPDKDSKTTNTIKPGYDFNANAAVINDADGKSTGISSAGNYMIIPTIDGIYYGTSRIIDVTMNIALKLGSDVCILSREVRLQRQSTDDLFSNATMTSGYYEVEDGTVLIPNVNTKLLNDTLQIVLDEGESVNFEISKNKNDWSKVEIEENTDDYTKTEYISITKNLKDLKSNLKENDEFYIRVISNNGAQIFYNGNEITDTTDAISIGVYSNSNGKGISLNINSKKELLGSNYKTETLYFLYSARSGQTYQQESTFRVYQLLDRATSGQSTTILSDYAKVESGSQIYYAIPFASWGATIGTTKCIVGMSGSLEGLSLSGYAPYKFAFEGVTGCTVDKSTGLIITDSNIQVAVYRFSVKVYLKVSGQNGQFEDDENLIELGVFEFMLDQTIDFDTHSAQIISIGENGGVVLINQTDALDNSFMVVNGNNTNTVTTVSRVNGLGVRDITTLTHPSEVSDNVYAVSVNSKIDASIADEDISGGYNKNYRLVAVDGKYTSNQDYVFTTTGEHTVTFAVTYRVNENSSHYTTILINKTVWVYDNQTQDDLYQVAVDTTSGISSYDILDIMDGGSWYYLDDNGKMELMTSTNLNFMGSQTETYNLIYVENQVAKHITLSFFAYNNSFDKSAIITTNTSAFDLNHITSLGNTTIYKILSENKMQQLRIENSFNTVGEYIVVGTNSQGKTEVFKYTVNYNTAEDSTTLYNLTVSEEGNYQTELENLVELSLASKNIQYDEYEILQIANNIFLETPTYAIPDDNTNNVISIDYLVTYKFDGAVAGNFKIRVSYTIYSLSVNLEYSMENPGLVYLSSLDDQLLDEINKVESITASEVRYYDINGNLRQTSIRVLTFPTTEQYYVQIGGKFFKLTVTFTTPNADEGN